MERKKENGNIYRENGKLESIGNYKNGKKKENGNTRMGNCKL